MRRAFLIASLCLAALAVPSMAATPARSSAASTRYIALVADELTKAGGASGMVMPTEDEPERSWRRPHGAIVLRGAQVTREAVAQVLASRSLRGRHVVLLLRGHTTAGPSSAPAWLVHARITGADALLDTSRLVHAADLRGWLARSGAASVVMFIEGGEGVDALCQGFAAAPGDGLRLAAWCQRAGDPRALALGPWLAGMPRASLTPMVTPQEWLDDVRRAAPEPMQVALAFSGSWRASFPLPPTAHAADANAKALGAVTSGTTSSFYYLLRRGYTCRPPVPGSGPDVPSWVDRIEWPASGPAVRWGSRCNDTGEDIARSDPELRLSSDRSLLLYRGQRYLRLVQPPAGDGVDGTAPRQEGR